MVQVSWGQCLEEDRLGTVSRQTGWVGGCGCGGVFVPAGDVAMSRCAGGQRVAAGNDRDGGRGVGSESAAVL